MKRFIFCLVIFAVGMVVPCTDAVAAPAAEKKQKAVKADPPKAAKKDAPGASSLKNTFGSANDSKDSPVFIRSDSLDVDSKGRIFTYYDNVEVLRGDMRITAERVIGRYDSSNQIEHIQCENNVVITRGDTLRANSNRAAYDVKKGMIVMTEAPELNDHGNVLTADKVTIDVTNDKSRAEGHVRVKVLKTEGQQP